MSLSANSVFEVRTAGSDTNGGGFVTGASGADYSQQNSKNSSGSNISTTDAVAAGTTTITSATAAFTSAIVGNIIYLAGGTGSLAAGWYQVATFVNVTTITVDRTVATGTGITMNIGGALLSPGQASAIMIAGNICFVRNVGADGASVYSITSATGAVAGGAILQGAACFFQGYTSTRSLGNTDARPTIQLNVSTAVMWLTVTVMVVQGFVCDGNSQTAAKAASTNGTGIFVRCMFKNFNTATTAGIFVDCSATTNSASIFVGVSAQRCEAYANTATPFNVTTASDCIASGNTGATTDGFTTPASTAVISGCISVSNGRDGFHTSTGGNSAALINCYAESNTGFGFNIGTTGHALINCAAYSNTSGATSFTGNQSNAGFQTLTTGSAFVNAGSNNYALNNTAGEGAALRAAANPTTFPRGLTSNFRDIGAAQHQDSPSTTNVFVIDD
jgi:hypothetical protein